MATRKIALFAGLFSNAAAQDLFLARPSPSDSNDKLAWLGSTVGELSSGNLTSDCGLKFEVISKTVANQGKFAVWDENLQAIFYVDSPAFTKPAWQGSILYAYKPGNGKLYEVYRCETCTIGSVMPRKSGGLVLAISNPDGGGMISSVETMDVDPTTFKGVTPQSLITLPRETKGKFNNGNCDPSGRLWLGTFDYGNEAQKQGKVWVVERNNGKLDLRVGIDQIGHPNGLIWSRDGASMLFSETWKNVVFRYTYSQATGEVSDPREVVAGSTKDDVFDSTCGFEDGSFLVTEPGHWMLKHFNSDGSLRCAQNLPGTSNQKFVASCAFGNGDLYVPTGRNGGGDSGPDGWVFRARGVSGGVVSHPCDI